METKAQNKPDPTTQRSTIDQALLPMLGEDKDIVDAEKLSMKVISGTKNAMAVIEERTNLFKALRRGAIAGTQPEDWDVKQDREGRQMASPGRGAAEWFIQLYGINFENMRDTENKPISVPVVTPNADGSLSAVIVVDAYSVVTGQRIEGVRGERNDREDFVGRSFDSTPDAVKRADLVSATYTAARKKAAMALASIVKVPLLVLKDHGLDITRCTKGSGFGTGDERRTAQAVSEDTMSVVEAFKLKLIGYCGGDEKEALVELAKLTRNEKNGTVYEVKTWAKLAGKPDWAIKKAIKKFEDQIASEEGRG